MSTVNPTSLAALVRELERIDVELPDHVSDAAALLEDAVNGELTREAAIQPSADLLTLDREGLLERIRQHAALRLVTDTMAESSWQISLALTQAVASDLAQRADDLIDQMRPRFDRAAKAVHAATKLGLHFGITPTQIIDLAPAAVTAWHGLPEHVATLEEIAHVRNTMTDLLGIAPEPDPFGPRQYGAAFGTGWVDATGTNRWLRLSGGMPKPLSLLSIADTHAIARATRVQPRPVVPQQHDGSTPLAGTLAAW